MLRMLIAENEEMIRKGLVYTMDWPSIDCVVVAEAVDGRDGYEKILGYRLDVIITDVCIPFMDGIEMIKKASEQVRFKGIFLASYMDFEHAGRAIETRVCEYLLKPMGEGALADIMERLREEIMNSRRVGHVMEQAGIKGGDLNLEYYIQSDLPENQYVSRAIKAVREDFARKLSIESISDGLGASASYLSRKFKEVTG